MTFFKEVDTAGESMTFFLNRATNTFTRDVGILSEVRSASFKARDSTTLEVKFHDGLNLVDLPTGFRLVFVVKTGYQSSAGLLAFVDSWTTLAPGHYSAPLNLNTQPLADFLGDDAFKDVFGEMSWSADGEHWESSGTLLVRINNDLYKGVEGTPLALETPDEWLATRRPLPMAGNAAPVNEVLGAYQSESFTVVAAAGCTVSGAYMVTVTASGLVGSPVGVSVPLTTATHTTAALIAEAIITALAGNLQIAERFIASASGAVGSLTRKGRAANDATLNISLPAGMGVSAAPSSANTTAGAATTGTFGVLGQEYRCGAGTPYTWYKCQSEEPTVWALENSGGADSTLTGLTATSGITLSSDHVLSIGAAAIVDTMLASGTVPTKPILHDASFTATVGISHGSYGNQAVVTNPSGQVGDTYSVWVMGGSAIINGTPYTTSRFPVINFCLGGTYWAVPVAHLSDELTLATPLSITSGGTGTTTASAALAALGGEPSLGHPTTNGYLLSRNTTGGNSWVAPTSGPKGDTGLTGSTGSTGATGAAGAAGTNGTNGTNGAKGDTGATGTAGAKGDKGDTGSAGTNGTNGTASPPTLATPTTAYVVTPPSGTHAAGDRARFLVTPSVSCALSLASGVRIPSDSAFTGTKTLTATKLYIIQLEYSGTFWMLESLVGGY